MAVPQLHVEITGDASSALEALASVQAAINALHGKTVNVDVNVRGGDAALSALRDLGEAARNGHTANVGVDHSDVDAARENLRGLRDDANDAARAIEAARSPRELESGSAARARDEQDRARRAIAELGAGPERPMLTTGGEDTKALGELEAGARDASEAHAELESSVGKSLQVYQDFGDGVYRATGALEDFSHGANGAREATEEAGGALERWQHIGLRDFSSELGGATTVAGDFAGGLKAIESGLSEAEGVTKGAGMSFEGLGDALGPAGKALGAVGGTLQTVGRFGLISALGMGALAAATAGLGAAGVFEEIRHVPALMYAAHQAEREFSRGLLSGASEAATAGVPAFRSLGGALHDIGHELGQIGAANIGPILQGLTGLGETAAQTMRQMAPAIAPATQALFSLGGAALQALGNSAPEIARFSNIVTANAGGLEQATEGVIKGMSVLGGETVKMTAAAAPLIRGTADLLGGAADFVNGIFGLQSNFTAPPSPDGSVAPGMSGANLAGRVALGAGSGAVIGGLLGSAFFGIGAIPGALIGGALGGSLAGATAGNMTPDTSSEVSSSDYWGPGAPGTTAPPPVDAATGRPRQGSDGQRLEEERRGLDVARRFGSGAPEPSGFAGQELSQIMQDAPAATSALQQLGQTGSSAFSQVHQASETAGQGVHQQMQQMTQSVQQAPPQIQQAAQAIPQAVQQGVQSQPQAIQQPVQQMVKTAVQQTQPEAQQGGADLGQSITDGTGQGVTKTETETLTIIKKWITRVIDEAASALDAHSPSRVFEALGESIPDGLTVGVANKAATAVTAVQQLVGGVVQNATHQLGGAGRQLSSGDNPLTQQLFGGGQNPLDSQLNRRLGLDPLTRQFREAQDEANRHGDAIDRNSDRYRNARQDAEQHRQALERLGYSGETVNRVLDEQAKHKAEADAKARERQDLHEAAMERARFGTPDDAADRAAIQRDAERYREQTGALRPEDLAARQQAQSQQPINQLNDELARQTQSYLPQSILQQNQQNAMQQGHLVGQNLTQGAQQGVQQNQQGPVGAVTQMAQNMVNATKKLLGISSPSQVYNDIASDVVLGMVGGLGSGVKAASDGVTPIANNAGLMVGYQWARSMVTGVDTVIKSADFTSVAVPQIQSALAKTALGQMGLLGPAGSGAQIYNPTGNAGLVSFSTTPQVNATINVTVDGGQPMKVIAQQVVDASMTNLTDKIAQQRG